MDYDIEKMLPWLEKLHRTSLPPTDVIVVSGSQIQVLRPHDFTMRVHPSDECQGRTCVIHSPTDHSMRGFPIIWRADRGIFERMCPHGIGHPDPDQEVYWYLQGGADRVDSETVHGCDGCCI